MITPSKDSPTGTPESGAPGAASPRSNGFAKLGFWTLLATMILSLWIVLFRVDLTPKVESDFFFSTEDPAFQASRRISELFPSQAQLIVAAQGPDIAAAEYVERIGQLTETLLAEPGIADVQSLTRGPTHPQAVAASPIWSRLLLSSNPRATQLIVSVTNDADGDLVNRIEAILEKQERPSFDLEISGVPYVVELIRRYLKRDLRIFSVVALLVFGLVIGWLYRSLPPVAGTLLSCVGACLLTLAVLHAFGTPIGILTANLATIVFVLTLSHTVFLTTNWKRLQARYSPAEAVRQAVGMTFAASFWCMVAALSGFGSLLLANAKPLRELGVSGMVGTTVAILVAYGFYPAFLRTRGIARPVTATEIQSSTLLPGGRGPLLIATACLVAAYGLSAINTDPSVFAYFAKGSEIRSGLELFDRSGGSSPLQLVISDPEGGRLDSRKLSAKLEKLQESLEKETSVGVALSLPVLLAEAKRVPLAALLSTEQLVNILDSERYNHIARSFVDDDRRQALFFLRMRETDRQEPRRQVISRLRSRVDQAGLKTELVGGLYDLQGKLGELVASSLVRELGGLLLFFVLVAFAVARSPRAALAMVACLTAVPILLLGFMGHLRLPVDVISAPGANVAISLGIDAMIHLMMAVRRSRRAGDDEPMAWANACAQMRRPIVSAMLILATGFGIFTLSSFPPTQRFGLLVSVGTLISAVMALIVLPFLATWGQARIAAPPP